MLVRLVKLTTDEYVLINPDNVTMVMSRGLQQGKESTRITFIDAQHVIDVVGSVEQVYEALYKSEYEPETVKDRPVRIKETVIKETK